MTSMVKPVWEEFRELMPVTRRLAYLDHAAVSPLPGPTRDVLTAWAAEAAEWGDMVWPRWARRVEEIRRLASQLIGADPAEVAFVSNTTTGISLVAEGWAWQPGDNVVTWADEFPSNLYPWMNLAARGVETRRVAVAAGGARLESLWAACDARTRLVSVSWVGYATGWRMDLDELVRGAHARGILVFLDAIQGLGVFPLDLAATRVDFLAADGHKWLLGPEGAGIVFVRREHLERLRPIGVGWNSVRRPYDFDRIALELRDTAARYEGGSWNMCGILALGASLELLQRFGWQTGGRVLAERVWWLTEYAADRLRAAGAEVVSPVGAEQGAGIVAFTWPGGDPQGLRQLCLDAGVAISCRAGRLRISPHAYNDSGDIDRLLTVLGDARA